MSFLAVIAPILTIGGTVIMFGALLWFIARGFKDFAFPDFWLLLTGISIVSYAMTRWDRAKLPLLLALGGFLAAFAGSISSEMVAEDQQAAAAVQQATQAFERGVKAMQEEKYEVAIECFTESSRLLPSDTDSLFNRAFANFHVGNYDAVIEDASAMIRIDPEDAEGYALRAAAYRELGDDDKASRDEEKAVQLGLSPEE